MSRDDAERIEDIREACRKLSEIASAGRDTFNESWLARDAASHNLSLLGEALNNLSDEFSARNSLPIREAKSLRNLLQHKYWTVDHDILWDTITDSVLAVQKALEAISTRTTSHEPTMVIEPIVQDLS